MPQEPEQLIAKMGEITDEADALRKSVTEVEELIIQTVKEMDSHPLESSLARIGELKDKIEKSSNQMRWRNEMQELQSSILQSFIAELRKSPTKHRDTVNQIRSSIKETVELRNTYDGTPNLLPCSAALGKLTAKLEYMIWMGFELWVEYIEQNISVIDDDNNLEYHWGTTGLHHLQQYIDEIQGSLDEVRESYKKLIQIKNESEQLASAEKFMASKIHHVYLPKRYHVGKLTSYSNSSRG